MGYKWRVITAVGGATAGAVGAAGVPAAATAYVGEKMFGEQFDKLTTIKYQIKGTFEQPQVAVKDSFSIIPKQVGEAVMRNDKDAARQPNPQPTPNSMPEAQQESTP